MAYGLRRRRGSSPRSTPDDSSPDQPLTRQSHPDRRRVIRAADPGAQLQCAGVEGHDAASDQEPAVPLAGPPGTTQVRSRGEPAEPVDARACGRTPRAVTTDLE